MVMVLHESVRGRSAKFRRWIGNRSTELWPSVYGLLFAATVAALLLGAFLAPEPGQSSRTRADPHEMWAGRAHPVRAPSTPVRAVAPTSAPRRAVASPEVGLEPSDTSPAPDVDLRLVVVDSSGDSIEGARVAAVGRGARLVDVTDSTGSVSLFVRPGVYELAVTCPGYADLHRSQHVTGSGASAKVTLVEEAVLSGDVLDCHGSPVSGAKIWAWLPAIQAPGAMHSSSRFVHSATSDRTGSFSIGGLDPRHNYQLFARRGRLVTVAAVTATCSESPRTLEVRRAVAFRIHFVDEMTGEPVRLPEGFVVGERERLFARDHHRISERSGIYGLIGGAGRVAGRVHAFTPEECDAPSTSLEYEVWLPGYEPARASIDLETMGDGELIEDLALPLMPRDSGFGSIELVVSRSADVRPGSASAGFLVLRPEGEIGGHAQPVTVRLGEILGGREVLDDIPAGRFRIEVLGHMTVGGPLEAITVIPDEVTVVPLGKSGLVTGSVVLDIRYPDGTRYGGMVTAAVGRPRTDDRGNTVLETKGTMSFSAPPYALVGLTPGAYRAILVTPSSAESDVFDVRSGQTANVVLSLGEL